LLLSYLAVPQYRASAKLIVSPNASLESGQDIVDSLSALDRRSIVSTYAEVLSSQRMFEEAGAALQLTPERLSLYTRQAVVLPDASVLELSVVGPNPAIATLLANHIGQGAIDYISQLNQVYDVKFLDIASVPDEPFTPQPIRDVALALALGLIGGSVLAIASEQLRIPLEALRRRNMMDSASSAYNRRYFQRRLEEEMARHQTSNVSLGLVQLTGLRDLMDTLPPVVTQKMLHQVTGTLRDELRGNDSVGRWDEMSFAVLLPATPGAAAARTLERIHRALSKPMAVEGQGELISLDPHIGVAACQGTQAPRLLAERAEAALERARQNGNGTGVVLDNGQTSAA
jgi:diguanylate cyclase (GGDEF)-like protein